MRPSLLASLATVAIVVAACGSGTTASPAASSAAPVATSAAPAPSSAAPSTLPSAPPSPTANACAIETLKLVTAGKLTIGTDNPAYPPYFMANADDHQTKPWNLGDPTNGQGFEAAAGYAIAKQLGFTADQVAWLPIKFDQSYASGPKTFDIDLNKVAASPAREMTADLSTGYYFGNQSLVMLKTKGDALAAKAAGKTLTLADLRWLVFGAQVGTTSLSLITDVIKPTAKPSVYDTTDGAVEALKNQTIDGIVIDLPTADYVTNVQVEDSVIVSQFDAGTPEHFSAVLGKGSPLTECINAAIQALTDDGTLKALASKWLPFQDLVPVFKP